MRSSIERVADASASSMPVPHLLKHRLSPQPRPATQGCAGPPKTLCFNCASCLSSLSPRGPQPLQLDCFLFSSWPSQYFFLRLRQQTPSSNGIPHLLHSSHWRWTLVR
ncbi:hypothetical protein BC835DRAFT_1398564 [Cytidiella melzeri]|nr:hypothetical protein BC835DRAFT_1398564 [Cytidiella melzeri]